MIDTSVIEGSLRSPTVLGTASVLILAYFLRLFLARPKKLSLPVAKIISGNGTQSLMDARAKYPDTPFVFPMGEKWIILPHSLVTEVSALPSDKASFSDLTYARMQGRYVPLAAFKTPHPEGIAAIKNDLTRNIASIIGDLQDEVAFAFDKVVGDASTWKEMYVYGSVLQIVGRLSARTFVGLPLCRDDEWIKSTINITTDTVAAVNSIAKYGPWTRPIMGHFVPELNKIREYSKYFAKTMEPKVSAVMAAYKGKTNMKIKPSAEEIDEADVTDENNNLIHWTIRNFKDPKKVSSQVIGDVEIGAAFAAIHTTSMALSHAIFDLAAHPEWATEIRQELNAVIEEENYPDKLLRKTSMPKLRKLDSFIKESQRLSPPGMIALGRMVSAKNGLTLSTGHHLPKGTKIGFGSPLYPTSSTIPSTFNKNKTPPLSEFYPWRYSDIRGTAGEENRHQFVSLDTDSLAFGSGPHACPGRFFASNEIKVVLTELVKRFDIGLGPEGQGDGVDGFLRPKLMEHDTFYAPDPYAKVYLKNRKV